MSLNEILFLSLIADVNQDEPNETSEEMLHESDRIVDSNVAAANSNLIEIRRITLPRKNIVKGRPKGSGRTVVGTKKKNSKNADTESASSNKRVTRSVSKISPSDTQRKRMRM